MKSRTPIAVTALLALALAGCADGTNDTTAGASGTPSSSATAPSSGPSAGTSTGTSTSAGPNIGDTLLIFTRTGGLAGTNDRLVVRPDGAWTLTTKSGSKEGKLTAAELTALKGALEQVGFSKLPKSNGGGNVADGYKYTVSYGGDEIAAEDGAVPTALQPVITTLNGLLSR